MEQGEGGVSFNYVCYIIAEKHFYFCVVFIVKMKNLGFIYDVFLVLSSTLQQL